MNILESIIIPCFSQLVQTRNKGPVSRDTVLVGADADLSSIEQVRFIILVEDKVEEIFEVRLRIVNDQAMSQKNSPFKTLGSLANFVDTLLGDLS